MPVLTSCEHYPIIVRRYVGTMTDAQQSEALATAAKELAADRARRERIVNVLDLTEAPPLSPTQRKRQSEWMAANSEAIRLVSMGTGFLVTSPVIGCILTALFWMTPPPDEYLVTSDPRTLVHWVDKRLKANGLATPVSFARALERRAA